MKNRIDTHQYCELPDLGAEISFHFNGKHIQAYTTDTITSALIASGQTLLSRSFKYHRPRGAYDIYGQGHDCLLYTSPSPRDQRGSRMPSSA